MEIKLRNGGCVQLYRNFWNKCEVWTIQLIKTQLKITEGISESKNLKYQTTSCKNSNDAIRMAMYKIREKRIENFKFKNKVNHDLNVPDELQSIIWKIIFNTVLNDLVKSNLRENVK